MPTDSIGNWQLLKLVWKARLPRGAERVLIGLLAYGAAESMGCYPSLTALSKLLAMDRRNVLRGMRYLVESGIVTRELFLSDSKQPTRKAARSRLNLGALQHLGAKTPLGAIGAKGRGNRRLGGGAKEHPKETIEETIEETKDPPTPQGGGRVIPQEEGRARPTKKSSKSVRHPKRDFWAEALSAMTSNVLKTDAFKTAWESWIQYKREKRKTLALSTIRSQIRRLEKKGHDRAIETIEWSVGQGWTGLYEPKDGQGESSGKPYNPKNLDPWQLVDKPRDYGTG